MHAITLEFQSVDPTAVGLVNMQALAQKIS